MDYWIAIGLRGSRCRLKKRWDYSTIIVSNSFWKPLNSRSPAAYTPLSLSARNQRFNWKEKMLLWRKAQSMLITRGPIVIYNYGSEPSKELGTANIFN